MSLLETTQYSTQLCKLYKTKDLKQHRKDYIFNFNPNQPEEGGVRNGSRWYILLYNVLVPHPNFINFGNFS